MKANRIPGIHIPKEADLKRKGRGAIVEQIATVDGVDLSVVSWLDNKVVNTLSTYVGAKPEGQKKCFFRKEKTHKMVPCPKAIITYNNYMGDVDLLDSMLGYYRISIRSKKWYHKIMFHVFDLVTVNAWILWWKHNNEHMPLIDFKIAVADALWRGGKTSQRKRGRPSNEIEQQLNSKRKRGPAANVPQAEVRQDGAHHFPTWRNTRGRCKFPDCNEKTFVACEKCEVTLCLNNNRNCFKLFHVS